MSDCFVLYLLLICMKKEKTGAGKFTNNTITNQDGKVVYNLIDKSASNNSQKEEAASQRNMAQEVFSESLYKELERTGVALDTVLQRYGISTIQDMDETTYKKAINSLKRTKTKVA